MDIWNAVVNSLRNFFNPVLSVLLAFLSPITSVFLSLVAIVSWLLGALIDPQGFMNGVVNKVIDVVASILPSTPTSLKVGTIINSVAALMPNVGRAVISEIFISLVAIFGLVGAVKLYKLIPFKAT